MNYSSRSLIQSVLWNFFGNGWLLVLAFFATPFIVHRLGVDLYGILTLVGITVGYFAFLELGLGYAMVKYISQYLAQGDEDNIRKTFWSCILVYFSIGSFGTILIILSAPILVDKLFNIPQDSKEMAFFALRLGAIGFLLSMLSGASSGVLRALGRFDFLNRIGIILGTLQTGLTVLLLVIGFSLKEIILTNLIIQATGFFIYLVFAKKFLPYLRGPCWDTGTFLNLFRFGGFVTISSVTGPILINIEKVFLTALHPIAALTYYSVPYSITTRFSIIPSSLSAVLFPAFSFLNSSEDKRAIKELHYRGTLYILLLLGFPVLFFALFSRLFLTEWMGADFAIQSTDIMIILSFAILINALASPSFVAIQGLGKPAQPAMYHVIETIIHIPVSYLLIRYLGGVGAAWAWFIRVSIDTILLQRASCRNLGISLMGWYRSIAVHGSLPILTCGLLLFCLKKCNLSLLHPAIILGIITTIIVYFFIVWKWGLDATDRKEIKGFLANLNARLIFTKIAG
jgi:O-antigen/teichoic acid export membrane protein